MRRCGDQGMIDTIKKAKLRACGTVTVVLICCEICGYFSVYVMEVWDQYLLGLHTSGDGYACSFRCQLVWVIG